MRRRRNERSCATRFMSRTVGTGAPARSGSCLTSQKSSRSTWLGSSDPKSIELFGSRQPSQNPVRITQSDDATSDASREPGALARPGSISMKYVDGVSSGNR